MKTFVIKATNQKSEEMFYADDCTGWWSACIDSAKMFESIEDAKKTLSSADFTKECTYSDGVIHPPRMISDAANLSDLELKGSVKIEICEIALCPVYVNTIDAEIKLPKKVVYIYLTF